MTLFDCSQVSRTTSEEFDGDSIYDGLDTFDYDNLDHALPTDASSSYRNKNLSSDSQSTSTTDVPPESSSSHSQDQAFGQSLKRESSSVLPRKRASSPSLEDQPNKRPRSDHESIQPLVVAYNRNFQRFVDAKDLSFGVQYEIARLVTTGRYQWGDLPLLDKLKGRNNPSARNVAILLAKANRKEDMAFEDELAQSGKLPWEELDREEDELERDPFSGLGYDSKGKRKEWYGGKIHFRGRFQEATPDNPLSITVERAELGSSSLLTRRFGSKNFMRIKVPKRLWHSGAVKDTFRRPVVIMGSVFRAYWAHDLNIFLLRTNEVYDQLANQVFPSSDSPGIPFLKLFELFNPLELNASQTMTKWSSRVQLGCSNSVPGVLIKEDQIEFIPDVVSEKNSDMTDGCGFCSRSILSSLYSLFEWPQFPHAIQCRVAGSKGLLIEKPNDMKNYHHLWLRDSQRKIKYRAPLDRALRSVDILRSSKIKTPARLNYEVIINLHENGVNPATFGKLVKDAISDRTEPLMNWDGPDAMLRLWNAVAKSGGVTQARKSREAGGESRARGYGEDISDDEDGSDDELDGFDGVRHFHSEAWYPDRTSGQPSSLEETVMYLLDSGFTPMDTSILREKLHKVINRAITSAVRKYRVEVRQSLTAFIVPDPCDVLEPGEVYVRSSNQNIVVDEETKTDQVLGDVLVTRSPCKLPTDVQKWVAVDRPELHHLKDVIVMSVKGSRRSADYLGGGDYDGDKCLLIWDPTLVKDFRNADLSFADEPLGLDSYFQKSNILVSKFLEQTAGICDYQEYISHLQHYLLAALDAPSIVGEFDALFIHSMYKNGYKHDETKKYAYLFCKVLDGAKTGLRVQDFMLKQDKAKYGNFKGPEWHHKMLQDEKGTSSSHSDTSNRPFLPRGHGLEPFIMDELWKVVRLQRDTAIGELCQKMEALSDSIDYDLVSPWEGAQQRAKALTSMGENTLDMELNAIAEAVETMHRKHHGTIVSLSRASESPTKQKGGFTALGIVQRQDTLRKLSKEFHSLPEGADRFLAVSPAELPILRASYAYKIAAAKSPTSRFCWDLSMRELCEIKAKTLGRKTGLFKTVSTSFYEQFSIKPR